MKTFLRLSILPIIGLLLMVAAYFWSERDLRLRFSGQPAEGRIVGMALQREDGRGDILVGLDTNLVFCLANGEKVAVQFRNYTFESASLMSVDGSSRPLSAADLEGGSLGADLARVVSDSLRGDAEITRWALMREARRTDDPQRVVRIEKSETVRGSFDLETIPVVMAMRDGELVVGSAMGEGLGTVTIRAVFDRSDPATIEKNKGDSLVSYEYLRNGQPFTPEKRNFFLFAEPYGTQFFPVFGFDAGEKPLARLSHIGRHGGPTLALQLFGNCRVYYDPENPAEAILTAVPGPVKGDPLGWFSRLCEGVFGQWGSTSLIVIAGGTVLFVGLLFISLVMIPHGRWKRPGGNI